MSFPYFSILFLLLSFSPPLPQYPFTDVVAERVQAAIASGWVAPDSTNLAALAWTADRLPDVYTSSGFRPKWVDEEGLNAAGLDLYEIIRHADRDGLNPRDYQLQPIEASLQRLLVEPTLTLAERAEESARLDILLTSAYLHYGHDITVGRIDPRGVHAEWDYGRKEPLARDMVNVALQDRDVTRTLSELHPRNPWYTRLLAVMRNYGEVSTRGGWAKVRSGVGVKLGDSGAPVIELRARLRQTLPDLLYALPSDSVFDEELETKLKAFQRSVGLQESGILDEATIAELNVPVERRMEQIAINLERMRWFPDAFGDRHVVVNIPDFRLRVFERDREVLSMATVVGKHGRETPMLIDTMTTIVLNPYWHLPPTVVGEDILPKLADNTKFLETKRIKVLVGYGDREREVDPDSVNWKSVDPERTAYRLRMDPGPANSLGKMKFLFPNRHAIYIHDSPSRSLFKRQVRAYSSGCVRVEGSLDLAAYLLADTPPWTRDSIAHYVRGTTERHIALKSPIRVYFLYLTAWVDPDGTVQFRKDLYGWDTLMVRLLEDHPVPV